MRAAAAAGVPAVNVSAAATVDHTESRAAPSGSNFNDPTPVNTVIRVAASPHRLKFTHSYCCFLPIGPAQDK